MTDFQIPKSMPHAPAAAVQGVVHTAELSGIAVSIHDSRGNAGRHASMLEQALQINCRLFDVKPPQLRLTVVNNLAEWKSAARQYGHLDFAWGVTLDDGDVVAKSPEYAGGEQARFEKVVTHETNHSFWVVNFGRHGAGWSPNWVIEGLANLAASARDLYPAEEIARLAVERRLDARALEYQYRDMSGKDELIFMYSLWRAVMADVTAQGLAPLMNCLRAFVKQPTEQSFEQAFRAQFGHSVADQFASFLRKFAP